MASSRGHARVRRDRALLLAAAGLIALAAIVAAILASSGGGGGSRTAAAPSAAPRGVDPSPAYERAARIALPSVVQIQSEGGLGSGVVLDDHGDIVTNAHVVTGFKTFVVVTADGKRRDATLRGAFPEGDLAVVRVADTSLPPARFADSSKLVVGQAVLAVGSPLGLLGSVTDGIVSAKSRTVAEAPGIALPSVVQTSAAINPGNSGGALVDLDGAVVGIPTLAAGDTQNGGRAPGIGFAISSNSVRRIAPQLADQGKVQSTGRGYLGVELGTVPQGGAAIVRVVRNGPAARAGLRVGDLVVTIDGTPVTSADDVALALAARKPGDTVTVEVRRQDGSTAKLKVALGELPAG